MRCRLIALDIRHTRPDQGADLILIHVRGVSQYLYFKRRITYDIVPPVNVSPGLSRLSGVWKGTVTLAGGSEMCVAMVVKEVFPDGRVMLAMAWNVSMGGREDINNFVGLGDAPNWPNKVENGELRIDSGTKWNGTHYYYVMKLPTAANPDVMEGSWMTGNHPQPVVLHRNRGR